MDKYSLEKFKYIKYKNDDAFSNILNRFFSGDINFDDMHLLSSEAYRQRNIVEYINSKHPMNYIKGIKNK